MDREIAVSILGKENKAELVNKLIDKGFKWIHYDVMDGEFVPNTSIPNEEFESIVKKTKPHIINVHLMVSNPEEYVEFYSTRADFVTIHYEADTVANIKKIIKKYSKTINIGLAIKPATSVEKIFEFIPNLSHVLVMSVEPGKGGQKFIPEAVDRIKQLKKQILKENPTCFIQVDGGITDETGPLTFKAGALNAVSGSFLLNNLDDKDIANKIKGQS